jgi:hypothetical protein
MVRPELKRMKMGLDEVASAAEEVEAVLEAADGLLDRLDGLMAHLRSNGRDDVAELIQDVRDDAPTSAIWHEVERLFPAPPMSMT